MPEDIRSGARAKASPGVDGPGAEATLSEEAAVDRRNLDGSPAPRSHNFASISSAGGASAPQRI